MGRADRDDQARAAAKLLQPVAASRPTGNAAKAHWSPVSQPHPASPRPESTPTAYSARPRLACDAIMVAIMPTPLARLRLAPKLPEQPSTLVKRRGLESQLKGDFISGLYDLPRFERL